MIIRDEMPPIQSMASGKTYDSKSAIRAEYKARGLVEVGNDTPDVKPPEKPKVTREEIGAAVQKVRAGYRPSVETESVPTVTGWH